MKVIGYGICGPGEANRYMKATMDEFKRLCDEVVILGNNAGREEQALVESYGFKFVSDSREWGRWQWKIKQDFLERDVRAIAENGDMMVCLDMDEILSAKLTSDWLYTAPLDAYHVFIVDLWNNPGYYKPQSCFWNVRIWRWNGMTEFKQKPVHCGLAPEWTYHYHRHAPFILKHFGLMDANDRERKVKRYQQYDPNRTHLPGMYYDMLKSNTAVPFDEARVQGQIEKEVASYKQRKPQHMPQSKKKRFAFVKNPQGIVVDIPEHQVAETLKRKGFEFVSWADDKDKEMGKLFDGVDVGEADADSEKPVGSYQSNVHGHGPDKAYVPSTDGLNGPVDESDVEDTKPLSDDDIALMAGEKTPEDMVEKPLPSPTEKAEKGPKTAKKATPAKGKGTKPSKK